MQDSKKAISLCIVLFMMFSLVLFFSHPSASGQAETSIIGYGPVEGDIVMPITSTYANGIVYVLDILGVSQFDASNGTFLQSFPIQSETNTYKNLNLIEMLRMLSTLDSGDAITDPTQTSFLGIDGIVPSMGITKSNECIVAEDWDTLGVYAIDNGERIRSITLPALSKPQEDSACSSLFHVVGDHIHILSLEHVRLHDNPDENYKTRLVWRSMDTSGNEIQRVVLNDTYFDSMFYSPLISSFAVSPDESKFVFCTSSCLFLVDAEGNTLVEYNFEELDEFINVVSFFNNTTLYTSGLNMDAFMSLEGCNLSPLKIQHDEKQTSLQKQDPIILQEAGFLPISLQISDEVVQFITMGMMEDFFQYRTFCIQEDTPLSIGSYPSADGQICGSIACVIDENHWLYETSIGQDYINVFNEQGMFEKRIPIDLGIVSSIMGIISFFPIILDMEIEGDYLYLSNAFVMSTLSIARYSFETEQWELLFADNFMNDSALPFSTSIEVVDETVYALSSNNKEGDYPVVYTIDSWGDLEEELHFIYESSDYDPPETPFWLDFCYDTQEELLYFLDAANKTFLVFDSDMDLMDVIPLQFKPIESKLWGMFSSFTLCEDTFYVTDVMADIVYHFNMQGNMMGMYGKQGTITVGKTKEQYQENPHVFFGAWKVRMAKNHTTKSDPFYVSDFGNFRYHKVFQEMLQQPKPYFPSISILHDKFSVFSKNSFSIPCTVEPKDAGFSYTLSSDAPWITFPKSGGVYPTDPMNYEIDGTQLKCWDINNANIIVSFPDLEIDEKWIEISVNAIGNKIALQIGSSVAILNDTIEIPLDKGSIPTIFEGRTYVAIRFLSEEVFRAEVDWNAEDRSVTFRKDTLTVTLFIGKKTAIVNGKEISIDAPPMIIEGRTLVPLRFISENLGASVEWEAKTQTVTLYYPKAP
ncbi:MAG: copper amine oxidase N-terminal domain-containing protein [Caldisericia bacterium]|nr:copper amine oxidase N-terminal domain-containing protein [Caldisericia bacterium]